MRLSIAMAVAYLTLGGVVAADPAQAAVKRRTDIPAQALGSALQALAKQRDFQIVCRADLVTNIYSSELSGEFTSGEALGQLLSGTNLTYRYLDDKTVTIVPMADTAPAAIPSSSALSPQSPFSVVGTESPSFWSRFLVAQAESSSQVSSASSEGEESGKLEEIVVTAQKRSERLQDVPISMSVLRGEDLDKSTAEGMTEILNRVPGVSSSLAVQGSGTQLVVRGVTANGPGSGSSPIAYYLDSVPFGLLTFSIAPDPNVYDLERVEVLRGPQGTLYGASAQNGVVRILTKDANPDDFELKARTSASSTEGGGPSYRGDMAINVPIVEGKLAARAAVGYQNLGGWIDAPNQDEVNDAELLNYRLKINAQPTEELSVGLSAWRSRSDYGAPSASDENGQRAAQADESITTNYDAYGLKIGYAFSGLSVSSMTSYLEYENGAALDLLPYPPVGVVFPLFTSVDADVLSQEVILNSTHEGSWRWSAGGIYRDAKDRVFNNVGTDNGNSSKSAAVFGELTRILRDGRFELTGGLRYFDDEVTQIENLPAGSVLTPIHSRSNFTKTSPRAVLTWHPSDTSTLYGSYSEGFRSGFVQNPNIIRIAPQFPPLEPDNLKNYEVGAKGSLLNGRVGYDTAVFYIDWQDVQQQVAVIIDSIPNAVALNAGSASGLGFEFALTARPVGGLDLGVNFSWNDLTADGAVFDATGANLFEKGDRLNYSAEYTAGASADYAFPLRASGFEAHLSASANYTSEQVYRSVVSGVRNADVGSSMVIARASFAIEATNHWTATLFVDNLNNEDSPGVGLFHVPDWQQRVRPRTLGLQFDWRL